ncbi:GBP1 protein, partial [Odontophorus gujanensis]|nr:GBP1 protein [Odontophorus gujanensis]
MEASAPLMSAPLRLVHNENCRLSLNPVALAALRRVTQPVVVVAIVGPYRTGKSFLMNWLAQKRSGFPLGQTVKAQTKGIWVWCLPHPCRPGTALVLLDTEGLGEPSKGDSQNDAWIFTLAVLLSSPLVYNSRNTSHAMVENLWVLKDLTDCVRMQAQADGTESGYEFVHIFPDFVWVMRDFTLQLGESISEDDYLERIVHLQPGYEVEKRNELWHRLRSFFPRRKLFTLDQPAADRDLAQMEVLLEDQLQQRFRQQVGAFCSYIWKEAPVKVLPDWHQVTGSGLACLVESYVAAITTGSVPCVETALTVVAEAENSAVVEAAVAEYQQGMEQGLVLPTASHDALMAVHQDWKQRAITFFLSHALANTKQRYQELLMDKLEVAKEEFCRRNEEASEQRCHAVLRELWGDTQLCVQRGHYTVPGGMRLLQEDLKFVLEEYKRRPNKGVKAAAVLEEFTQQSKVLMNRVEMTEKRFHRWEAVLAEATAAKEAMEKQMEKHRQQHEAALAEMRAAKEAAEARVDLLEQQQKVTLAEVAAVKQAVEKQLEEQQRQRAALAEVIATREAAEVQLEERWRWQLQQLQEEQRAWLEEQNEVLAHRLQEHEAQLQEGRGHEAAVLQQTELMQEDQHVLSWRCTLLKFVDKVLVPILIRLVNS